mgnify:CR=1 FL=1
MKPTSLRPDDSVQFRGSRYVLRFVRRDPSECARPAMCWFCFPDGELCAATDADVMRRGERIQSESRPRG